MAGRRGLVINAVAFLTILILVAYFTVPTTRGRPSILGPIVGHGMVEESTAFSADPEVAAGEPTTQLIIGKLSSHDTSWLSSVEDMPALVYVVDDASSQYHLPANKGNEVMTYLTYIIDHYDALPDVSLFVHPHRVAWHNNDLLDNDITQMLRHLNLERVLSDGYMNLRCQWGPGCPEWLRPGDGAAGAKMSKQEQLHIGRVWKELFPQAALPESLSGPCCGQFAVSRDAVRGTPLARYTAMRDWVLATELSDYIVGRCFEYLWQYIFAGAENVCPDQHVCYCDGYGLCFENDTEFQRWFEIRHYLGGKVKELKAWHAEMDKWQDRQSNATSGGDMASDVPRKPSEGYGEQLQDEIDRMERDLADRKGIALQRGQELSIRRLRPSKNAPKHQMWKTLHQLRRFCNAVDLDASK